MIKRKNFIALFLTVAAASAMAQQAATPAAGANGAAAEQAWKYKTKRLERNEVDALLAKPEKLVVIDVRRPDELTAKGSFPVYLNIQNKELEKSLAYIPKDRVILTVSNHAVRAGAAGDLLAAKGFTVAGATGSEDYEAQGGTITKIAAPPPRNAAATPTTTPAVTTAATVVKKDW
ncbi:rhodanese-like domain-containing protein [Undibacterium pigrum]|uniref:Rhodanese-related sulfurtransferase n=1 Tax=Undibacterium pigrum TaxID=401470 RepID=A0A318JBH0_9BURK|nr:rhodanese-like domain-containing protein [Undibacterium pigrum]PXX44056.1 rhodanese-related sulfurtransferase [Undibacterium pigrum]